MLGQLVPTALVLGIHPAQCECNRQPMPRGKEANLLTAALSLPSPRRRDQRPPTHMGFDLTANTNRKQARRCPIKLRNKVTRRTATNSIWVPLPRVPPTDMVTAVTLPPVRIILLDRRPPIILMMICIPLKGRKRKGLRTGTSVSTLQPICGRRATRHPPLHPLRRRHPQIRRTRSNSGPSI